MADNVIVRVPEQQFIRGEDGYSPEVTIEDIAHGHSVNITDREHPEGQSFDVLDGASAYEQAVAGGYTGTEAQFNEDLSSFKTLSDEAKDVAPFYAVYGQTTKAEIAAAINGKRQIYARRLGGPGYLPYTDAFSYSDTSGHTKTGHRFSGTLGTTQWVYELKDSWNSYTNDLSAPAQAAESAAAEALIRMRSADASAQAAATTATTFTEQTVPAAVNTINEAKADALTAVGSAQTTAVGAVQQESTTQQAAIQQKGEDVLDSIPSDYTELSEDVDELKSAVDYVENAIGTGYKLIEGHYVDGSGVIVPGNYNTACFYVDNGGTIDNITSSAALVYAFYVDEPSIGSTSYNNSRTVLSSTGELNNLAVPNGVNWIAVRIPTTGTVTISPKSTELGNLKKDATMFKGNYTGNLDDVKDNSIRYVPSSVASSPLNTISAGALHTFELVRGNPGAYIQLFYGLSTAYKGVRFTRAFVAGAWNGWKTFDTNLYNAFPVYHAFGDSVMLGAKWIATESSPYYRIETTPEINKIPTRIANAIGASTSYHNNAVSGSPLVGSSNTILSKIEATDMTGVKLITVGGGRNDSNNQLGSIASTAGDGTICGAVREIIEYLQSTYPKAQIVWIGVTPHGDANNNVFTWVTPAGWTLNTFDDAVSAVCAEYCVPYVNWKKCSYMMHWSEYSAAAGNYVHPDNDESYMQIGNYIAAQVAQYYRG